MHQPDAIAAPASRPLARLEKRAGDARVYIIDCSPLLRQHELMAKVLSASATKGVKVGEARTRRGRFVEVHLSGGGGKERYTDGELSVSVVTSMGQLEVCVAVRVHGGG